MKLTLFLYRLISIGIVMTPMLLNVMFPYSVVTSLLFIPLLMLGLSLLFIYLDKQLHEMLAEFINKVEEHKLIVLSSVKQNKLIFQQEKRLKNNEI